MGLLNNLDSRREVRFASLSLHNCDSFYREICSIILLLGEKHLKKLWLSLHKRGVLDLRSTKFLIPDNQPVSLENAGLLFDLFKNLIEQN